MYVLTAFDDDYPSDPDKAAAFAFDWWSKAGAPVTHAASASLAAIRVAEIARHGLKHSRKAGSSARPGP